MQRAAAVGQHSHSMDNESLTDVSNLPGPYKCVSKPPTSRARVHQLQVKQLRKQAKRLCQG